jgi:hypothetical protein
MAPMKRLSLRHRLALGAALGLCTGTLASCNAIFGISPGIGTGGAASGTGSPTGSGGMGGLTASSSAGDGASSSTGGHGTGGHGTGGSTTSSTTTGTGGTVPDAGPLKCDGTDPGGTDGSTAKWAVNAFDAVGAGAGLRSDGSVVIGGNFDGSDTVLGSAPLSYPSSGNPTDLFLARFSSTGQNLSAQSFPAQAQVGVFTEDWYNNTGLLMAVDKQGRTAVAGNFRGSFTIGSTTLTAQIQATDSGDPDSLDGFVALFDASWNTVWPPKLLGSALNDSVNGVAIDGQGNVLVLLVSRGSDTALPIDAGCGATMGKATPNGNGVFVSKIGLTGACAWSDNFSVTNGYLDDNNNGAGMALAVDPSDDVILVGGAEPATTIIGQNSLGTDGSNYHAFAAKLSGKDGSVTWRRAYEDGHNQNLYAVATDPCGNIIVGGGFAGGAPFGSPPFQDPPGAENGDQQGMLVKLDPVKGDPIWADQFVGLGWTGVTAIQVNHASDIALVGLLQDGTHSVGIDFLGKTLLPPSPLNVGQTDFYVAKLKGDGSLRWVNRYGGEDYDFALAVALDDAGHLVATGSFASSIDFGSGVTVGAAESGDFFAVEFGP